MLGWAASAVVALTDYVVVTAELGLPTAPVAPPTPPWDYRETTSGTLGRR
jgi:hypothetical protein